MSRLRKYLDRLRVRLWCRRVIKAEANIEYYLRRAGFNRDQIRSFRRDLTKGRTSLVRILTAIVGREGGGR